MTLDSLKQKSTEKKVGLVRKRLPELEVPNHSFLTFTIGAITSMDQRVKFGARFAQVAFAWQVCTRDAEPC